jgi:glycosyltransferase involved in cell wall biosynthesis
MRIGIMLRHYEQHEGGVKHYTKTLLPLLFSLGTQHQYTLIYQNPKLLGTYAGFPNVEELVSRMPGTLLWDQVAVPWVTRNKQLDIIFNPKFTIPFFTRAKTIFVLHGSEWFVIPDVFIWYDNLYTNRMVPLYCRHADAFISVADAVKADAVKYAHADPKNIYTVHNAIDPKQFYFIDDIEQLRSVRSKYRLPEKYIVWVGQIDGRKNVKRLLQAFAQVAGEFPHNLVIVGEQRRGGEEELSVINELGIADRVNFIGWVQHDDLPAIYRMADLFSFPSRYEGFGIPLVEAMACGCPIVTANTCSPPEVVDGAALLVDPYDVAAIAEAMRMVLRDRSLREKMIARGLERAKDFSWDKCARQVLAVFDAVAGPHAKKEPGAAVLAGAKG